MTSHVLLATTLITAVRAPEIWVTASVVAFATVGTAILTRKFDAFGRLPEFVALLLIAATLQACLLGITTPFHMPRDEWLARWTEHAIVLGASAGLHFGVASYRGYSSARDSTSARAVRTIAVSLLTAAALCLMLIVYTAVEPGFPRPEPAYPDLVAFAEARARAVSLLAATMQCCIGGSVLAVVVLMWADFANASRSRMSAE